MQRPLSHRNSTSRQSTDNRQQWITLDNCYSGQHPSVSSFHISIDLVWWTLVRFVPPLVVWCHMKRTSTAQNRAFSIIAFSVSSISLWRNGCSQGEIRLCSMNYSNVSYIAGVGLTAPSSRSREEALYELSDDDD